MKRCRQFTLVGVALGIVGVIAGCGTATEVSSGTAQATNVVNRSANNVGTQTANTTSQSNGNLTNNSLTSATAPNNSKSSFLTNMDIINSRIGYVAGYSEAHFSLWRTTDGGTRWTHILVPHVPMYTESNYSPVASFESTNEGWIAWIAKNKQSNVLQVLNTTDGGRTWTLHTKNVISVANYVRQIDFSSAKDGWIQAFSGGVMNQGDTTIYHTDDGGKTWTMVSSAGGYVPNKSATSRALPELDVPMPMTFTNAQDGWVALGNVVVTRTMASLYYTHTAGAEWKAIHLPIPKEYQNGFMTTEYAPVFTDNVGTALVQYYHEGTNRVVSYVTTNTGKSWVIGSNVALGENDNRVRQSFLNAQDGWIIGNTGTTFKRTTNGGKSWLAVQTNTSLKPLWQQGFTVQQLDMVNQTTGWILLEQINSQNGQIRTAILKTTNGGHSWVVQNNTN